MRLSTVLEFKGTWREYQSRVLEKSDKYLEDGKLHIVAAPGSGKTTLGIELIRRLGRKTLVLAPSITIREQWIERIKTGFLVEGVDEGEYLSQDIRCPKAITAITYQALHSAMRRLKGTLKETWDEEESFLEEVDFSDYDILKTIQEAGIEVICLDECHHLRSEWWKALEDFVAMTGEKTIISLTATPPYDSNISQWERYIKLCGEIDEEITVPELVKEGSLCPHQDFVYFNYPTKEEKKVIDSFKDNAKIRTKKLLLDEEFAKIIASHIGLNDIENAGERFLEDPSYLSAILIFLKEKGMNFSPNLLELLGVKHLPGMKEKWMELLLQGVLYDDRESYYADSAYLEQLETKLKHEGLVDKRKVTLVTNSKVEKLLISSKGKVESIKQIVRTEYEALHSELRMLILTDYIKKEYISYIGKEEKECSALGVIPFFEVLRREHSKGLKLGVLCGSVVILPTEAKERLEQLLEESRVSCSTIDTLANKEYMIVTPQGGHNELTQVVTQLFTEGSVQVLIGTKALLGEGWDAPCINSLILASFVGSYMLSNQMRGRAIRVMKENPNKTSNVWHLVCMYKEDPDIVPEDYQMLERRMEHFMGLHYEEDVIENGIGRLSLIKDPTGNMNIKSINRGMCQLSKQREELARRWENSLAIHEKMEIELETLIGEKRTDPGIVFLNAVLLFSVISIGQILVGISLFQGINVDNVTFNVFLGGIMVVLFGCMIRYGIRIYIYGRPITRLVQVGKGIIDALNHKNLLTEDKVKAEVLGDSALYFIALKGGMSRDKELFAQCVMEFFNPLENQRYILVHPKRKKKIESYYVVPEAFSKRKEDAMLFAQCLEKHIGKYEPIYTRSPEGRKILLAGRRYAYSNKQQRCISRKKVKGGLE